MEFADEDTPDVVLSWQPVTDSLELSADPDYYIVYTRQDDGGFDNGIRVDGTTVRMTQQRGHTYSYRVTAVNKGGESFPSETLAAHRAANERGSVLVINGFERVSAPMNIQGDSLAGFYNDYDSGAAYIKDISFIGQQRNFDRALSRSENDNDALGSCYSDYETRVIAGNTFDYPVIHGRSIAAAGYSFCSASVKAVERGARAPLAAARRDTTSRSCRNLCNGSLRTSPATEATYSYRDAMSRATCGRDPKLHPQTRSSHGARCTCHITATWPRVAVKRVSSPRPWA